MSNIYYYVTQLQKGNHDTKLFNIIFYRKNTHHIFHLPLIAIT